MILQYHVHITLRASLLTKRAYSLNDSIRFEVIALNQAISRKTLCGYLFLLRQALTDGRNYPPSHVVFFDSRSFYFHFAPCPCGKTTVEGVLQKMEPCIPLAITDESLALFLTACKEAESDEKADSFLQSSKADFLMLLRYAAGDEGKWQAVTALCESLRLQNEA